MPVQSIFWPDNSAEDVHLVPGYTGPRLDHLLWISDTGGNRRADNPPAGVAVAFAANFVAGAPGTNGVAVNANGEVTVTAPLSPSPRLLDFLVVATVTEAGNPSSPFTAYRRFRIHEAITRMWLTPSELTVRRNARNVRPTLLAEFTDGTYGDLTTWCPWDSPAAADRTYVRQTGVATPAVGWGSGAAGVVGVDPDTGVLSGNAAAGTAQISATLAPLPAPPAATATGTARGAAAWSTPVTLTHLDGPGFPGMATSPNVLILADGFEAGERAAAERLARSLVHQLGVRRRTRPFDILKHRLNYFFAWVPSREAGVSPLPEVERSHVSGNRARAEERDTSVAPGAVAGASTIGPPPTPATNDRFLLNERDTAFHCALSDRPRAQRFRTLRSCHFSRSRFSEDDFDAFLNALQDGGGAAVGAVWARTGKDQDSILVLSRTDRNGGSNISRSGGGRYIAMTLDREDHHRIQDQAAGFGKDVRPDPVPARVNTEIWTTAAHELAHSFTLDDEYGGSGPLPASKVASAAGRANIQARATLLTGGNLDANLVKWRWPRLTKAGITDAALHPLGGNRFRVLLQATHAGPFAVGDVVRFRVRDLLPGAPPSARFIVVTKADPELEVEALTADPFLPGNFPAGSLLIAPKRGPDPDAPARVFGDDLELMHVDARARINATRNPLNANDGDPANRACVGAALGTPTGSTNWPDTDGDGRPNPPSPPRYSSWVVGLYENGDTYDCDIYRPTGVCLMRTLHYSDATSRDRAYQFCPVCRYAMVDLLDPTKHGIIDADYDPRYPT